MKELNVIGTMQLLAACQKAPSLRHLVVKSTTTVYGASSRDPAMFTEDMEPRRAPARLRQGRRGDRGLRARVRPPPARRPRRPAARRQRDRPARDQPDHVVLPAPGDPDGPRPRPRLQFLHEHDLLAVLQHAALTGVAGTYNVAGDGVLMLSQAIRRLKRPSVPLPPFAVGHLGSALQSARLADFSPEQLSFLTYGRGVDDPHALDARLPPDVHDGGGLRRLRVPAPADRRPDREAPRQPGGRAAAGAAAAVEHPFDVFGRSRPWLTRRSSRSAPGTPGRGTGKQPSSAARGLASAGKPPGVRAGHAAQGHAAQGPRQRRPPKDGRRRSVSPARSRSSTPRPSRRRTPAAPTPPPWTATPGSLRELLAAFQHAAKELFGTSGRRSSPGSWPSCAAGSPATTSSTSTASTRRSPSAS